MSISIILSLAGGRISDDFLTRQGYRQVIRISGKDVIRIFGTCRNTRDQGRQVRVRVLHKRVHVLSAEDRIRIRALHDAWLNAELLGDSSALLKLCTPVPVWLPPNEPPLCGRETILEWLEAQPHATVRRIDIADLAISGIGPFACKVAAFRTTLEGPADATVVTGTHVWLLERDDATAWRIRVVAWTIAGTIGA